MAASLYDSYDQNSKRWNRPQRVNGGRKRVATAKGRDKFGRLLPNEGELPEPENHGSAGGKACLEKYGREYFVNLAKRKTKGD